MSLEVNTYVERPSEFQGVLFTGGEENGPAIVDWIVANGGTAVWLDARAADPETNTPAREESIRISTPNGPQKVEVGWYIVKMEPESNGYVPGESNWSAFSPAQFNNKYEGKHIQ